LPVPLPRTVIGTPACAQAATTARISSSVFGRTTASARRPSSWRLSTGLNQ